MGVHDGPERAVWERREDTAGEQVAFDCRKPEFYLIEPRGVRRRKVQMQARIRVEARLDVFRLVRGQVIDDDVDLRPPRLRGHDVAETFHKGIAGVAWHRLADDLARPRVERRVQRERAVPVILKAVAL